MLKQVLLDSIDKAWPGYQRGVMRITFLTGTLTVRRQIISHRQFADVDLDILIDC